MQVINDARDKEVRARHPNMTKGIDNVIKAMEALRPTERHPAARFDGLTHEDMLELPVVELIPEWGHWLNWTFKVTTVGQLLELGWSPILAKEGVGRQALWVFTDAIRAVGLNWPNMIMDGHSHPARPKPRKPKAC